MNNRTPGTEQFGDKKAEKLIELKAREKQYKHCLSHLSVFATIYNTQQGIVNTLSRTAVPTSSTKFIAATNNTNTVVGAFNTKQQQCLEYGEAYHALLDETFPSRKPG